MSGKVSHPASNFWFATVAALMIVVVSFIGFVLAEPQITRSQTLTDSAEFSISQTITGESTFNVPPANVTMEGDINGITGGNATGSSQFVVQSNNASGWYVNIRFDYTHGGAYALIGDSGSEDIFDYGIGNAEPDFGFTPEPNASFAYTVEASTTPSLIDDSFEHNNIDTCGGGGGNTTAGLCWATPSSTDFRIIDSSSAAPTGATSTITFRVNVPSGATPAPAAETYTATATLSLYTNP
jgi:hypothetical protein